MNESGLPGGVSSAWMLSVAVIGLYLSFIIPIFLRLRMGDRFTPGPWTLGRRYKLLGWIAVVEIAVPCFHSVSRLVLAKITALYWLRLLS